MARLLALAAGIAVACAQTNNIVQTAQADPELRALVDALVAGGLVDTLSGPGPFTVFAPINQAFDALGPNILDFVFNPEANNVKQLDSVLTYHVVSGAVTSSQLKDGQVIPTVDAGNSVTAHVNGNDITINNARVVRANIMCSNGVVHIVDHVLVPQNFAYPALDIVKTAMSVPALSTLVTAVTTGNLVRALTYPEGPYTVFAPTNDAFNKLPAGVLAYLLAHPQELDQVLTYHVVDARGDRGRGRLYADQIANFQEAFTLNGHSLIFVVAGGKVLVNGNATVVQANVDTENGVVHVIDTVLIPNQQVVEARAAAWSAKTALRSKALVAPALLNLLDLAKSVPQLSTLVAAVGAAGLASVLSGPGPLTVFAPTNDAFATLPADFLAYLLQPANKAELISVITYHVVAGNVSSGDLVDREQIPTVQGANITVHRDVRGAITLNFDARITAPNNEASNGVAHLIDHVLLPRA